MNRPDIRSVDVDVCGVCGAPGDVLHRGLTDRLAGVPGEWASMRCRVCAAVWLTPRPVDEDLGRIYENYYTHTDTEVADAHDEGARGLHDAERGYARARFGGTGHPEGGAGLRRLVAVWAGRRADAAYMAAHLPVEAGAPLLDVGCGDGLLLQNLRSLGWDGQGVELDPEAAAATRGRGIPVFNGSIQDAGFADGQFAAVTMSHVIEHLTNPAETLAEIRRVLRPGGHLVVMTPNASSSLHRVFGAEWFPLDAPRHLLLHSPQSLRRILEDAGFTVSDVRDSWRAANVTIAASLAYKRGRPYSMTTAPRWSARLVSEAGQQLLAMTSWLQRGRGDELVAIATRGVA